MGAHISNGGSTFLSLLLQFIMQFWWNVFLTVFRHYILLFKYCEKILELHASFTCENSSHVKDRIDRNKRFSGMNKAEWAKRALGDGQVVVLNQLMGQVKHSVGNSELELRFHTTASVGSASWQYSRFEIFCLASEMAG